MVAITKLRHVRFEPQQKLSKMSTPEPVAGPEPERLPTPSQCRQLHAIVNRQISEPASFSTYISQIREALEGMFRDTSQNLTSEESELFATLYQAISNYSARKLDDLAGDHLAAARIIMRKLRLDGGTLWDSGFPPPITLYALSLQSIPGQVVSHFLTEIRKCLANNRHIDSFGTLLNVGLSPDTKVMCCVFASRTPELFTAPTELAYEGISLPVLIIRNWICEATTETNPLASSWINKPVRQSVKIDLSGHSVGEQRDTNMAGTFGFYGHDAQRVFYGFTAAHCTPKAKPGSIIVSPSARELTGRLRSIAQYTKFVPAPKHKKIGRLESEVQSLLETAGLSEDSEDGCEIHETLDIGEVRQRKIVLEGPEFGRVVGMSFTNKSGVLEKHNNHLDQEKTRNFELPYDDTGKEGGRSRVEWCCFEIEKKRFGGNLLNSDTDENDVIIRIDLLKPDMQVFKIGRTTGKTKGTVNGFILQRWEEHQSKNEVTMEIAVLGNGGQPQPFAAMGDSGCLLTADGEIGPYGVGMVIGVDCTQTLAVVTPLWAILEDVEDKLHLGIYFY